MLDVIAIAIYAAIANSNDWQEVEAFAQNRHGWLNAFAKMCENGGEYLLTANGNQPQLSPEIETCFVRAFDGNMEGADNDLNETLDRRVGRQERRTYIIIYELDGVDGAGAWKDLYVIGQCYRERAEGDKTATELHRFWVVVACRRVAPVVRCVATAVLRIICIGDWT